MALHDRGGIYVMKQTDQGYAEHGVAVSRFTKSVQFESLNLVKLVHHDLQMPKLYHPSPASSLRTANRT